MAKKGRPSLDYNKVTAELICEKIATSSHGLNRICKDNPEFPSVRVVYKWLEENEDFQQNYARAREEQADLLSDEIIEIADFTEKDDIHVEQEEGEGYDIPNHEWIARSRLRVDARKWKASKLAPKKYGDKQEVDMKIIAEQPLFPD